jgi:hypothetical protein
LREALQVLSQLELNLHQVLRAGNVPDIELLLQFGHLLLIRLHADQYRHHYALINLLCAPAQQQLREIAHDQVLVHAKVLEAGLRSEEAHIASIIGLKRRVVHLQDVLEVLVQPEDFLLHARDGVCQLLYIKDERDEQADVDEDQRVQKERGLLQILLACLDRLDNLADAY